MARGPRDVDRNRSPGAWVAMIPPCRCAKCRREIADQVKIVSLSGLFSEVFCALCAPGLDDMPDTVRDGRAFLRRFGAELPAVLDPSRAGR